VILDVYAALLDEVQADPDLLLHRGTEGYFSRRLFPNRQDRRQTSMVKAIPIFNVQSSRLSPSCHDCSVVNLWTT